MPRKHQHKKTNRLPRILIVIGVLMLIIVLLLVKAGNDRQAQTADTNGDLPSNQLQAALAGHHPTLAFFHSNNCEQCIEMIGIIEQVYPEFADSIVLVDVNVYDERNEPLLRQVGLQYIPTMIFYNRNGQAETHVGVMEAQLLAELLKTLSQGE